MTTAAEITPKALADLLESKADDVFLLDVRQPEEVAVCGLPAICNIPMGDMQSRLDELPENKDIVVICHHGYRSMQMTLWLRQKGFDKARSLQGGVDKWAEDVDPSMPRY